MRSPMLTEKAVDAGWASRIVGPDASKIFEGFLVAQDREALTRTAAEALRGIEPLLADNPPLVAAQAIVDALLGDPA